MSPAAARHVLFDLDGTLVDSRGAVTACYARVFADHLDQPFPPPGLGAGEIFAMRPAELFARIAPDRAEALHAAYRAAYPACAPEVRVFEGVGALLTGLVRAGRAVSLVTNKGLERTLIDLRVAGIAPELFRAVVTAEDTVERKPHPAPIVLGLKRAGADPAQAVYVGDGPQDILAARAAGIPAVAVTYGFYTAEDLAPHAPAALVADVPGLAAALGLPADAGVPR